MSRKNGGIIGPANTPVGGLITGVAGGVWRMNDVANFVGNSQWPKVPENIDNSLRFNDGSSDYLSKTFGTATNRKKWTFSAWIKRSNPTSSGETIFSALSEDSTSWYSRLADNGDGKFDFTEYSGSAYTINLRPNALQRDSSAWYHFVLMYDSAQSTSSDRVKYYINGTQITSWATETYPSQNQESGINKNHLHTIGKTTETSGMYYDGYMAEVVFIDGQALDPTSFGEFDTTTGIWKPKKIGQIANAGTNSFYLNFKDSSNVGKDESGNSNNFTVNKLTSIDQSTDTCVENFVTMNPLNLYQYNFTFSEGNLKVANSSSNWHAASGTIGINKGKWYYEAKYTGSSNLQHWCVGYGGEAQNATDATRNSVFFYNNDGGEIYTSDVSNTTTTQADYGTFSQNDIIGIALDYDNEYISVYKNGSAIVTNYDYGATSYSSNLKDGKTIFPYVAHYASGDITLNFGNPPYSISSGNSDANGFGNFEYSVPSGYYAINTSNLNTYG